jgi:hypothetical protein
MREILGAATARGESPRADYAALVLVENGIEPGRAEIKSPSPTPAPISQPIYPYPQKAVYIGGDPRVASSYTSS